MLMVRFHGMGKSQGGGFGSGVDASKTRQTNKQAIWVVTSQGASRAASNKPNSLDAQLRSAPTTAG